MRQDSVLKALIVARLLYACHFRSQRLSLEVRLFGPSFYSRKAI
jgi:hypothetical protein